MPARYIPRSMKLSIIITDYGDWRLEITPKSVSILMLFAAFYNVLIVQLAFMLRHACIRMR